MKDSRTAWGQEFDRNLKLSGELDDAKRLIKKQRELLDTLLRLHEAEVWVAEPWNTTFKEVKKLLEGYKL
jgi:hypothetical protein